jgi:hypothetical protein
MAGMVARWLQRLAGKPARIALPDDTWQRALRRPAWTRALDDAAKLRLREFTERFLADKAITPARGFALTDDRKVLIAMLCCRPVLGLGYEWLRGWHEVIVYPGEFRRPSHDYDEHTGVVSEFEEAASGESWWRGPIVLSWADVLASVDTPEPGYDVVVHEIAHKLDGLHGGVDGAPRLHQDERRGWARDFQAAFDALHADLDAGREPRIDPYAGEDEAEFFAVCSEYWFTAPEVLQVLLHAAAGIVGDVPN